MPTLVMDTPGLARIALALETTQHVERRAYYVAESPWLAVVVLRHGLELETVAHKVVHAMVTVAPAPARIARAGNADKPHTIVSVFGLVDDLADLMLCLVMERLREDV